MSSYSIPNFRLEFFFGRARVLYRVLGAALESVNEPMEHSAMESALWFDER